MIESNGRSESAIERFFLGTVVATPGALQALARSGENAAPLVARHQCGDWGEVCPEDKNANEIAVATDGRILSAYTLGNGVKLWIITESDRSVTTVLLPDEY